MNNSRNSADMFWIGTYQGDGHSNVHMKILVPSLAAGSIIGKGGETIAQLQRDSGARVKMSKTNDYYPGTTERVCLITGSLDSVMFVHEFIQNKILEKPDRSAAAYNDHNLMYSNGGSHHQQQQPGDMHGKMMNEREKQVKILVPNSTAGMIIGKGGNYIKEIKEESGSYVQISQKAKDQQLSERCITVVGEPHENKIACEMILTKIAEDPQSSSNSNVSYADFSGPVANFNPTGSPFANQSSSQSNGQSSSSSSSTATALFNCFSSMSSQQLIENVQLILKQGGYADTAIIDVSKALHTLANYGLLGFGLGLGMGTFNNNNTDYQPAPNSMKKSGGGTAGDYNESQVEIQVAENLIGVILGIQGKSLIEIQNYSNANIQISKKGIYAPGTHNRIVNISGSADSVNTAHMLITQRLNHEENKRAYRDAAVAAATAANMN